MRYVLVENPDNSLLIGMDDTRDYIVIEVMEGINAIYYKYYMRIHIHIITLINYISLYMTSNPIYMINSIFSFSTSYWVHRTNILSIVPISFDLIYNCLCVPVLLVFHMWVNAIHSLCCACIIMITLLTADRVQHI